jgi:hypothetical protein
MNGQLTALVQELNKLIESGQTLDAMARFYADEVTMQENECEPRVGKVTCIAHEQQLLAGITTYKATLLRQAINEANGVVFSEWTFETTHISGRQSIFAEVSVQQWSDERIVAEKFYYNSKMN